MNNLKLAFLAGLLAALLLHLLTDPADARSSGARRGVVSEIIIHATGGPSCARRKVVFSDPGTLPKMKRFFDQSSRVSIHYIVGRNGKIAKGVPENRVAIHTRNYNQTSIGIEMINRGDGRAPFPAAQVAALIKLVRGIRKRHPIALARVLRHSDVDRSTFRCRGTTVRRKQDPGPAFDWPGFKAALQMDGSPRLVRSGRIARRR